MTEIEIREIADMAAAWNVVELINGESDEIVELTESDPINVRIRPTQTKINLTNITGNVHFNAAHTIYVTENGLGKFRAIQSESNEMSVGDKINVVHARGTTKFGILTIVAKIDADGYVGFNPDTKNVPLRIHVPNV